MAECVIGVDDVTCVGDYDQEPSKVVRLLERGDCFAALQSAREIRDQTAGVSLLAYPQLDA